MPGDLTWVWLWPLGLALVMLGGGWLYYNYSRDTTRAPRRRSRLYRCVGCGHVYADERDVPLARCGRCGKMNEAVRR